MGKRKTRRTRKRGGATTYTQNLQRGKAILREMAELLETELADKDYLTSSHKQQLTDQVEEYTDRLLEVIQPVPTEVRSRDREYDTAFNNVSELIDRLVNYRVGGRRQVRG